MMEKRNLFFTAIEGTSKGFWMFAGFLFLLALGGAWASFMMEHEGHYITGMTNQIPWGLPIVMAVYFIGLSAGSLVLSALSSVFGMTEFKPFSRIAALLAVVLIVGALLSIILDWGRPERLFIPFFHFQPRSMFSLNGVLYSVYMGIGIVYLWAMFAEKKKLEKLLGISAVFWAVLVHSGTGAIFGFVGARELYHSPLLPPSFIAAALSSGTALMILVLLATFRYSERYLDMKIVLKLARYLAGFIMIVTYFLFVENITRSYIPKNYELQHFLLFDGGKISLIFWLGMVGLGNIFPLLLLLSPAGKSVKWIIVACVMVVIGVLAERYIIVIPGQVLPLELFPGYNITSSFQDGLLANYCVSTAEILFSVGIGALVLLIYLFAIKFFEMLPVTKEEENRETLPEA
ncbi:MAG: polysulfide reductase NrfD [Nitrospinota bacterium]|nr:polysulfide reductase NrfD [Nitrospinota bacterium]